MGEYFHYINHTKHLQFSDGDLGGAMEFGSIGTGLAARAFCLLLTRSHDRGPRYQPFGLGAWIGNHVECIGDHGSLGDEYADYQIITANIIVFLYQIDGPDQLIQTAEQEKGLLLQLVHLANTGQCPALVYELERAFGADWRKLGKELAQDYRWRVIYDLANTSL
jgi:hypothetical protein